MSLYALEEYTIEYTSIQYKYLDPNTGFSLGTLYSDWGIDDPNATNNGQPTVPAISIVGLDNSGYYTTFSGSWYYTLNGTDYPITQLPFLLSGSETRVKFVPNVNEDGYARFSYLPVSYYKFTEGLTQEQKDARFFKYEALPAGFQLGVENEYGYGDTVIAHQSNYVHRNYAPEIQAISIDVSATSIEKYKTDNGISLATIIGNRDLSYNEQNSLDKKGIVVIGQEVTGNTAGIWQYKSDLDWVPFDFDGNGYYFENSAQIFFRFFPTKNDVGSAKLLFQAWDASIGSATKRAVGSSGGESSISVNEAGLTSAVEKVNYAPVISANAVSLSPIYEDISDNLNVGTTLNNTFFQSISYSDETGPSLGIVITDISNGPIDPSGIRLGKWQYSNASNVWTDITLASGQGLHLLINSKIRFVPNADKNGSVSIKIRGWDQYNNLANYTIGDISGVGGFTSYSAEIATVNLGITPVNDPAYFVDPSSTIVRVYNQAYLPTLLSESVDLEENNKILISSSSPLTYTYKDIDSSLGNFGIVITGISIVNSTYAGDLSGFVLNFYGVSNWRASDSYIKISDLVPGTNAIYMSKTAKFRFVLVPSDFVGDLEFTYYLWDQTELANITPNSLRDLTSTAIASNTNYSSNSSKFRVRYADANDTPILTTPLYDVSANYGIQLEDTADFIRIPFYSASDSKSIMRTLTITDADANTNVTIPAPGLALYEFSPIATDNDFNTSLVGDWYVEDGTTVYKLENLSISNAFHVEPKEGVALLFKPYNNIYGTYELKARVWDRSNDKIWDATRPELHATYKEITSDLNTPYSAETLAIRFTVANVNDSPNIVSGQIAIDSFKSTASSSNGFLLKNLLGMVDISDADPLDIQNERFGIVITYAPRKFGTFQYSIVSGTPVWIDYVDEIDLIQGLHLKADNNTRLRYVPLPTLKVKATTNIGYTLWNTSNEIQNGTIMPFQYVNGQISTAYSTQNSLLKIRVSPT